MRKVICVVFLVVILFSGCQNNNTEADYGSFTVEKTFSYDEKYYAVNNCVQIDGENIIKVDVYLTENDSIVSSNQVCRAMDFWGICWENDSYDIWVQSGDVGLICYTHKDGEWEEDLSAEKPEYIISKYD